MNLKAKLLTMTTADLIRAMPAGLRARYTEIDMDSYGHVDQDVCFGCAATNAMITIKGVSAKDHILQRPFCEGTLQITLEYFFNELRQGIANFDYAANHSLRCINEALGVNHFKPIHLPEGLHLPFLNNDYTEEDLKVYDELADAQPTDKGVSDSGSEK